MEPSGIICLCNNSTVTECLEKNLFGDKKANAKYYSGITAPLFSFLYNYQTDELFGVFCASQNYKLDIDKSAYQGLYPFQIRVERIGDLKKRKKAKSFFNSIGIPAYTSKKGSILPMPVLTKDQVSKVWTWISDGSKSSDTISGIDNTIISELIATISDSNLIAELQNFSHQIHWGKISSQEANNLLKYLRDNILYQEFPDITREHGLLRKSIKDHMIQRKICTLQSFNRFIANENITFDQQQSKYLKLIFEIIKNIK